MPTLIEAITMIDRDNAPMHDIDNAFTDFGMPMGPLHLADTVGLDVVYFVMGVISKDLGLVMPDRLEKLVKANKLGIKTGEGFYKYKNGKKKDIKSTNDVEGIKHILVTRLVEECEKCLSEGLVESADLIDAGMIFGAGFAPFRGGPLHYQKNNA
jgi:3-hydroxyacyl-CoA dehydrogenase/enoyl-CoA hydratase/3-hydroxybutyryl-CoA epimerase